MGGGFLADHPYLQLFIIFFAYLCIFVFLFQKQVQEYLDENWLEVRCYPHVVPFAGISTYGEGDGFIEKTTNNFQYCTTSTVNRFIGAFIVPFFGAFQSLTKGSSSLRRIIDTFRTMAKVMREMFGSLVDSTFKRLSNSYAAIVYLQERMKAIIKKQSAIFEIISQFFSTLPFVFYSFLYGPIPRFAYWLKNYIGAVIAVIVICIICVVSGGPFMPFVGMATCPICIACFDASTEVLRIVDPTEPALWKQVSLYEIGIGDHIVSSTTKERHIVSGVLYFTSQQYPMYDVNGVWTTGTHGLYIPTWKRVQNIYPLENIVWRTCDMVCLITDTHQIPIGNQLFGDFSETDDLSTLQTAQVMIDTARNMTDSTSNCQTYTHGIHATTPIRILTEDGTAYIRTAEELYHQVRQSSDRNLLGTIYGCMCVHDPSIVWYSYVSLHSEFPPLLLSGNTLLYENNQWIRVKNSSHATRLYHIQNDTIYHFSSTNGELSVGSNVIISDWFESYDTDVNVEILQLYDDTLQKIGNPGFP